MVYSIDDLINPFGKGVAVYQKTMILRGFEQRYYGIKDRIRFGLCMNGKNYIVHYKIPSESSLCKDVLYDVVIEFIPIDPGAEKMPTLDGYDVHVYTNSPSFIFSYTYTFNKYGLLVDWLKNKCMKQCLSTPALEKNPQNIIGTDKSVWFAAFHFLRNGLKYKSQFARYINATYQQVITNVVSQERMMAQRMRSEQVGRHQLKLEKEASKSKNGAYAGYRAQKDIQNGMMQYNASAKPAEKIPMIHVNKAAKEARQSRSTRPARSARSAKSARRHR